MTTTNFRYLRDPSTKVLESANLKAAYFYNSFFYNQFQRKDSERPSILIRKKDDEGKSVDPFEFGFGKIKSWTAKVNIFDYKYLIVPINER